MAEANATGTCLVENCALPRKGRGYCSPHYQRVKKHGDPRASIPVQIRSSRVGVTCSASGCDRPVANGRLVLCQAHYHRAWRNPDADVDAPLATPRAKPLPVRDLGNGLRECLHCGEAKPIINGFHRDSKSPGGFRKTCKKCRVRAETERYWADPAAAAAKVRAFRRAHPDHVRDRESGYYEKHKPARIEAAIESAHRRRASAYAAPRDKGISKLALRRLDGDQCCYCEVEMVFASFRGQKRPDNQATLEHVVALSRGGTHGWGNCALACWRCNISKGARDGGWRIRTGHRLEAVGSPMGA